MAAEPRGRTAPSPPPPFSKHTDDTFIGAYPWNAPRSAMRDSKGLGNFKNLFFYAPNGKPDGIKIVPLSEVATKDDFFNIKKVSAADLLDAHRVPFQLMGGKPENIGSMGDVEKVARVFVRNELNPLQERFKEINDWLGMEVIRFKDYSLESE